MANWRALTRPGALSCRSKRSTSEERSAGSSGGLSSSSFSPYRIATWGSLARAGSVNELHNLPAVRTGGKALQKSLQVLDKRLGILLGGAECLLKDLHFLLFQRRLRWRRCRSLHGRHRERAEQQYEETVKSDEWRVKSRKARQPGPCERIPTAENRASHAVSSPHLA